MFTSVRSYGADLCGDTCQLPPVSTPVANTSWLRHPFSNIRALTKLKVTVTYKQGQLDDIRRFLQAGVPVLAPVQTRELPHWGEDTPHAVVVVGMDAQTIYLNDPGFPNAPIAVPHGDFDLAWLEHNEYYAVLAP